MLGLFAAIGCGSGSTNIIHTTGNYSNASLNGTYVNRSRIESHRLTHGDELQIGKFKLAFLNR